MAAFVLNLFLLIGFQEKKTCFKLLKQNRSLEAFHSYKTVEMFLTLPPGKFVAQVSGGSLLRTYQSEERSIDLNSIAFR